DKVRSVQGHGRKPGYKLTRPEGKEASTDWKWVTVYDILTSPRYKGETTYGRGKVKMGCPVIVDGGTWAKVQARMTRHRWASTRGTRFYLLQGRVYCRQCGSRYIAFAERRSDLRPLPGEE